MVVDTGDNTPPKTADTNAGPHGPEPLVAEFWDTRPELRHIYDAAKAWMTGPWGTLMYAMAHALCTIPPNVMLPGVIGGRPASLNAMFAALGESGDGKDACEGAASEAIRFVDRDGNPVTWQTLPLGSGEGVARTFAKVTVKDTEAIDDTDADGKPVKKTKTVERVIQPVTAAMFTASEIDVAAALFSRQGSTTSPILRQVYTGTTIGFANSGKETRVVADAGTYRATAAFGVQPAKAAALLNDEAGGLPQRFVWAPVIDPWIPDDTPPPPRNPALEILSDWTRHDAYPAKPHILPLPAEAVQAMRATRIGRSRRSEGYEALSSHALLTRAKVAAALMALGGRREITVEDWELAGHVMDISDSCREYAGTAVTRQGKDANLARAFAAADREDAIEERRTAQARGNILRHLGPKPVSRSALTRKLKVNLRPHLDTALDELVSAGQVVEWKDDRRTTYTRRW